MHVFLRAAFRTQDLWQKYRVFCTARNTQLIFGAEIGPRSTASPADGLCIHRRCPGYRLTDPDVVKSWKPRKPNPQVSSHTCCTFLQLCQLIYWKTEISQILRAKNVFCFGSFLTSVFMMITKKRSQQILAKKGSEKSEPSCR